MRKPLQIALLTLMLSPLAAFAQQPFPTPEKAASALADALNHRDKAALNNLLGDNWQQFYPPMVLIPMPSTAFSATGR